MTHVLRQIRLDAEIRLGQELLRLKEAGALREGRPETVPTKHSLFLNDFDISRHLSSRAQFLAEHEDEVRNTRVVSLLAPDACGATQC